MMQRIKEYEDQFDVATKTQLRAVLPEHLPAAHIVAAAGAVTAAPSSGEETDSDDDSSDDEEAKAKEEEARNAKLVEAEKLRKVCIQYS